MKTIDSQESDRESGSLRPGSSPIDFSESPGSSNEAPVSADAPAAFLSNVASLDLRNIVVCLDGSPFSEQVLPIAAAWASATGMTLRLVHVSSPFMTGAGGRSELGLPHDENPERYLRELGEDLRNRNLDLRYCVIRSPYIARAIVDYAQKLPGSIIVLSSHGWTGLRRLAMGSIATKLLHECTHPVLILRPRRLLKERKRERTAEEAPIRTAS